MANIKINAKANDALAESARAFEAKFGRKPGPNDPLLFDPDEDEPTPLSASKMMRMMTASFLEANTPSHLIFAWIKTGMIMSEEQYKNGPQDARLEWDRTMAEFQFLEASGAKFDRAFFDRLMDHEDKKKKPG